MSNHLDPDQDRHFVGPELFKNRLQRISANISGQQKSSLTRKELCFVLFGFNIPPTAKVMNGDRPWLKVSSDRMEEPGIEPVIRKSKGFHT